MSVFSVAGSYVENNEAAPRAPGALLNNVQFTMEEMFGPIVELVGIQTDRTVGTDGRKHVMIFYFKIGPLDPLRPFPQGEKTVVF